MTKLNFSTSEDSTTSADALALNLGTRLYKLMKMPKMNSFNNSAILNVGIVGSAGGTGASVGLGNDSEDIARTINSSVTGQVSHL